MKTRKRIALGITMAAGLALAFAGWRSQNLSANNTSFQSRRSGQNGSGPITTTAAPPPNNGSNGAVQARMFGQNKTSDGTNLGGQLVDGTYTGNRIYTFYGYFQLKARVNSGRLSDVSVTEYPSHTGTSRRINHIAIPYLVRDAVSVQNSRVHLISGATLTSEAFAMSLNSALQQALKPAVSQG